MGGLARRVPWWRYNIFDGLLQTKFSQLHACNAGIQGVPVTIPILYSNISASPLVVFW